MELEVRLFAGLRERAGADTVTVHVTEPATVGAVLDALAATPLAGLGDGAFIVAVNRAYATPAAAVAPGDEVALIPPVAGGETHHVAIVDTPLDPAAMLARVRDPRAGALVLFEGDPREVDALHYEAYAEMAEPLMRTIVAEETERHGLVAAAVEHRIGRVGAGEAAVLVAASAPHRTEAFAGAQAIMDRVKAEAPVFKQEAGTWTGTLPAAPT